MPRTALSLGLPTVSHSIAMYLLQAGSRLVIQHADGFSAVARYQVAYSIGSLGVLVVNALAFAWNPLIWGAPDQRRWHLLAETAAAVWRLAALLAGLLALAAPLGC